VLALTPLDIALRNIIANAVRHHDRPTGHIDMTYERVWRDEATTGSQTWHVIQICDDGPGISSDDRELIFTPLVRLSAAQSNPVDGSGLGLAFVRRAFESVGGHVTVESDAPRTRGATFVISWPHRHETDRPS
ncbi:MAG: HAMP domain-containing sensor histidine kinase, partial [Pseudomonadota bacterium]